MAPMARMSRARPPHAEVELAFEDAGVLVGVPDSSGEVSVGEPVVFMGNILLSYIYIYLHTYVCV